MIMIHSGRGCTMDVDIYVYVRVRARACEFVCVYGAESRNIHINSIFIYTYGDLMVI